MPIDESTTGISAPQPRVVVTGGGTGGHISPLVALVERLRERTSAEVCWIGSRNGPEADAALSLGISYHPIQTGKLRRYASLSTASDAVRIPIGVGQSVRLLRELRPAVVVSSGGFVGVPAVVAARMLHTPSLTHEQTAHLGLATRINSRFSDVVALSFPPTPEASRIGRSRVVVTGNPVRSIVLSGDAERYRRTAGLTDDLPLVYVTGGAQGSHAINELLGAALPNLLTSANVLVQSGPVSANGDFTRFERLRRELPADLAQRFRVVERVGDEIGDLYAAASIVVGRAGAGTVAELAAVGRPSILIPLPGATEQRRNANALAAVGAADVLTQEGLTTDVLAGHIRDLLSSPDRRRAMGQAATVLFRPDAADRLVDQLLELCRRDEAT